MRNSTAFTALSGRDPYGDFSSARTFKGAQGRLKQQQQQQQQPSLMLYLKAHWRWFRPTAWPPIQRARGSRDAGIIRWPPHANVLYPFPPPKNFDVLGPVLEEALADLPAFDVTLADFGSFDRPDSSVLFLRPTATWSNVHGSGAVEALGEDPFQALYRRVRSAVDPYCRPDPPKKLLQPFVPHFTVTTREVQRRAPRRGTLRGWDPVRFCVRRFTDPKKGPQQPLRLRWRVPLGSRLRGAHGQGGGGGDDHGDAGAETGERLASEGAVGPGGAAYPLMLSEADVSWAVEVRRGLVERRKRGRRRKHRSSAAGKVED